MGYFKSLDNMEALSEPPKEVQVNFSCEMDFSTLLFNLNHIDDMSDADLHNLVANQYKTLLNYDSFFNNPSYRTIAQKAFSNERFLRMMLTVISVVKLNYHQITCLNKLTFDYERMHNNTDKIFGLLLQLSSIANHDMIKKLSIVVDESIAKEIAMVRMSSFNEGKNAIRLHNLLVYNVEDITAQDVVNILTTVFSRFTIVIIATMTLVCKDQSRIRNYNAFSVALLALIDNMSSIEMKKLIASYGIDYYLNHNGETPRFSLQNLGEKYRRISTIVKEVEAEEYDILIP